MEKHLLLIISGSVAAYKSLDLIRRLRDERLGEIRVVMTQAACRFVSPMAVSAIAGSKAMSDLFSLDEEAEMGHIRLVRDASLILIAPASANLLAKAAHGLADDLASACLLAADTPLLVAPAMNPYMWAHPATQANVATLKTRGATFIDPDAGEMACGEVGIGRLAEADAIIDAVKHIMPDKKMPLAGKRALVTAGPTHEAIDAVRYIGNHSSGKQGYAIAAALARLGAEVTLISGPSQLIPPPSVATVPVVTATDMLDASLAALPVDIAVCAAAVADWRVAKAKNGKMKKQDGPPNMTFTETPDILAHLSQHRQRPALLIGFAAESDAIIAHAKTKRKTKGADWIVANAIHQNRASVFGSDTNAICLIDGKGEEKWQSMPKGAVAEKLATRISQHFTST